jgi:UDPglucose 6-dehydrogenase
MRRGNRIHFMDPTSAELTKYASNAMLATRISFMNEMARFADAAGADIEKVRLGLGADTRIGRSFLFPGLGYGGSCFPKDVRAMIHMGEEAGTPILTVQSTDATNRSQTDFFLDKVRRYFDGDLAGKRFAVWGLSFKPNTDDMREAPSLKVINQLLEAGCTVSAHDTRAILGDRIELHEKQYDVFPEADGLIVCTEWMEFRTPDFKRIAELLRTPVIFDGRNLYDPDYVNAAGLDYLCIGRPDALVARG